MTEQARFIVLGSGGIFTFNVIKTLLDESFIPVAYIQSGRESIPEHSSFEHIELQVPRRANELQNLLNAHSIAMHYEAGIDLQAVIHDFNVEYMLVACWPRLIAESIIESVSRAALNLHPSLLPRYRGYDPVGEQLAQGDKNFGITLHLLNERYDEGDIVLQKNLLLSPDSSAADINQKAATEGAKLFMRAVKTQQHPGWSITAQ